MSLVFQRYTTPDTKPAISVITNPKGVVPKATLKRVHAPLKLLTIINAEPSVFVKLTIETTIPIPFKRVKLVTNPIIPATKSSITKLASSDPVTTFLNSSTNQINLSTTSDTAGVNISLKAIRNPSNADPKLSKEPFKLFC